MKVTDKRLKSILKSKAKGVTTDQIARQYGFDISTIQELLEEHKDYFEEIRREVGEQKRKMYEKLYKTAVGVYESILETPHYVDVRDCNGEKVGMKPDGQILKVKKEVAAEVISSSLAEEKPKKKKKETSQSSSNSPDLRYIIGDCKLEEGEVKVG